MKYCYPLFHPQKYLLSVNHVGSFVLFFLFLLILFTLSDVSNASPLPLDSTVTLTPQPGGVDGVLRGVTYTVVFDAFAGASTVAPDNKGEASNGDVGVDISGDISSNVVVAIELPDHLLGTGGTSMAITFPASGPGSGIRVETGGFFNPNISNVFNLGGGGVCKIRLGYVFTVPANVVLTGDIYTGEIRCIVGYGNSIDTSINNDTITVPLTIRTADVSLKVEASDGYLKNLTKNQNYEIRYNAYTGNGSISPSDNGELVLSNLGFNIAGDISSNVVLEIDLPNRLRDIRGNTINISFSGSGQGGGVRVETGGFFNPNVANTFNLGGGGTANVRLGYTLLIPGNTSPGMYSGVALCNAYYTGLAKGVKQLMQYHATAQIFVEITNNFNESVSFASTDLQLSNLRHNIKYFCTPVGNSKGYTITPSSHNERVDSSLGFKLNGTVGTSLQVYFTFPEYLTYTYHNKVNITFLTLAHSTSTKEPYKLLNPNQVHTITIGSSGSSFLRLGCLLDVPASITPGIYRGYVLCHVVAPNSSDVPITYYAEIRAAVEQSFPNTSLPAPVFELKQNYPNPFNPGTTITFELLSEQNVNLTIFNYLGEAVATLVSGLLPSGVYTKDWDATNFPSGIYFSRLQTEHATATKKLLLMR